ncbi:metallophosphoesterase [Saccharicrinis sp. FJH2]|uniref:metallophosphoesterase n=1 Tax=Saccharicrinis sp. FJH65 TaxID=3344659 RepID=UPI0035F39218
MRADFWFLFVIIALLFIVDGLIYKYINRWMTRKQKLIKLSFFTVYWIIPVVFSVIFVYYFSLLKQADTGNYYYHFMWIIGMFLLIYVPKLIYLFFIFLNTIYNLIRQFVVNLKSERRPRKGDKITRSEFLGKAGLLMAAIPFASMLYGMAKGRFNYYVKHAPIKFKNLPDAFDGYKIIQISDIHLGNYNKEYHRLYPIINMINDENPDLILFTGDLVNNFSDETIGWAPVFNKLKAKYGKYSILGNHDYGNYSRWKSKEAKKRNFDEIVQAHKRFGFTLLRNQNVDLVLNNQTIKLAGNENWGLPPFPQYGDLTKTLKGISKDNFTILMSHDPDHWEAEILPDSNVELTLAGHTHGMQMGISYKNLKWSPAKWKYRYWDGLYTKGDRHLYVNRGLGFIGIPMRIGMPPEITLLELRKA